MLQFSCMTTSNIEEKLSILIIRIDVGNVPRSTEKIL